MNYESPRKIVNIDSAEQLQEIMRGHSLRPASKQRVTASPDSWSWANTAPSSFVTIQSVSFRDDSHTQMLKHIKRRTDSFPCIKMSVSWINLSVTQAFVEYFPVSGACWNRRTTTRRLGLDIQMNQSISCTNAPIHQNSRRTEDTQLTIWHSARQYFHQEDRGKQKTSRKLPLKWNRILKWQSFFF